MELPILISLCAFIASFVFNVVSLRNAAAKAKQESDRDFEKQSRERAEQSFLLNQMNLMLNRLSSSYESMNDKLHNINERLLLTEERQKTLDDFSAEMKRLAQKVDRNSVLVERLTKDKRDE